MKVEFYISEDKIREKFLEGDQENFLEYLSELADELVDEYRNAIAELIFNKLQNYRLETEEDGLISLNKIK